MVQGQPSAKLMGPLGAMAEERGPHTAVGVRAVEGSRPPIDAPLYFSGREVRVGAVR